MNTAKKKYQKQCKIKTITFYKKDTEILKLANAINFQKFVKQKLFELQKDIEDYFEMSINSYLDFYGDDNGNIQDN